MRILNSRPWVLLLLCMSGNASVLGIDVFSVIFSVSLLVFVALFDWKYAPNVHEPYVFWLLIVVLGLIQARAFFLGFEYNGDYSFWPLKALFLFLFLYLFATKEKFYQINFLKAQHSMMLFGSMLIMLSMVLGGHIQDGRLSFIWGPNMLYRIVDFLLILSLAGTFLVRTTSAYVFCAALWVLGIYTLSVIGSRGGMVALFGALALFVIVAKRSKVFVVAIILSGFLVFMGIQTASQFVELPRFVSFGSEEEALRQVFRNYFFSIISQTFFSFGFQYSDFSPFSSFGFEYPHNIFIELIFYYGTFGWIASILLIWSAAKSLYVMSWAIRDGRSQVLVLLISIYWVFFLGVQMSGDLTDNFPVISIGFYMLILNDRASVGIANHVYRGRRLNSRNAQRIKRTSLT